MNEQISEKWPPQQTSAPASCTRNDDEIDLSPLSNTVGTVGKKDAIDFLLQMLDPLITLDDASRVYEAGRQTLRQTDSTDGIRNPWDIDTKLDSALRRYRRRLVRNPVYNYRVPVPASEPYSSLSEDDFRTLIGKVFRKLEAPYKVGASLYIYHQMQLLGTSTVPSLSKAQYLVDNALLHQTQSIPHRRRGDHRKIGDNWGRCFPASHYWAAFVVLAGNAFVLPEDALARFLQHADVDAFKRLAAMRATGIACGGG